MTVALVCSSLLAAGVGVFLRWWITRDWLVLYVNPDSLTIPKVCPACLSSHAKNVVQEDSLKRQTANYVVAQKSEWRRVKVFYCNPCLRRLHLFTAAGLLLGSLCAVLTFVTITHFYGTGDDPLALLLVSVLFGFPAYSVLTTMPKGVIFGKPHPKSMQVRIRHAQYMAAMRSPDASQTATPLPNGKGVWIH